MTSLWEWESRSDTAAKRRGQGRTAYGELERFSNSETVRARCSMERAGLIMELAHAAKGSYAECRLACDRMLARWSDEDSSTIRDFRATASLMRAETFYYEDNRTAAIEALTNVAETYSDLPRQSSMARHFLAHMLRRDGRTDEAIAIWEDLAVLPLTDADLYADQDINQKALCELVDISIERGRLGSARRHLESLATRYPENESIPEFRERLAAAEQVPESVRAHMLPGFRTEGLAEN